MFGKEIDGNEKKKCIIVHNQQNEVFAQLLYGLIGEQNLYEAAIWSEKTFADNQSTLSSLTKIVFVGESKPTETFVANVKWQFNEFDLMKYGWLGNRALLYFEKSSLIKILSNEQLEDLCEYAKDKLIEFKLEKNITNLKDTGNILKNMLKNILNKKQGFFEMINPIKPIKDVYENVMIFQDTLKEIENINELFYRLLVNEFFFNGLKQYMGD